jgi:hypothetical protein
MPIIQEVRGKRVGPVVYCDVCDQSIQDAGDGNVQWIANDSHGRTQRTAPLFFTHKRCCTTFDRQHAAEGGVGAEDLDTWLVYLSNSLKFGERQRAEASERARFLAGPS